MFLNKIPLEEKEDKKKKCVEVLAFPKLLKDPILNFLSWKFSGALEI